MIRSLPFCYQFVSSRLPSLFSARRLSRSRGGGRRRKRIPNNIGRRLAALRMSSRLPSTSRPKDAKEAISRAFVFFCFFSIVCNGVQLWDAAVVSAVGKPCILCRLVDCSKVVMPRIVFAFVFRRGLLLLFCTCFSCPGRSRSRSVLRGSAGRELQKYDFSQAVCSGTSVFKDGDEHYQHVWGVFKL